MIGETKNTLDAHSYLKRKDLWPCLLILVSCFFLFRDILIGGQPLFGVDFFNIHPPQHQAIPFKRDRHTPCDPPLESLCFQWNAFLGPFRIHHSSPPRYPLLDHAAPKSMRLYHVFASCPIRTAHVPPCKVFSLHSFVSLRSVHRLHPKRLYHGNPLRRTDVPDSELRLDSRGHLFFEQSTEAQDISLA